MITKKDIYASIRYYEQETPTIDNCKILASLYTCLDHMDAEEGEEELTDIIPAYRKYAEVKRKYQLHEVAEVELLRAAKIVCIETTEFLSMLYSGSDTEEERELIRDIVNRNF